MTSKTILLYGANGFTASLLIDQLKTLPCAVILAGRNHKSIESLGLQHELPYRIFDLDNEEVIVKNLKQVGLVINCAGPFSKTAKPLASACIKAQANYFDITGELEVFRALHKFDSAAKAAGIAIIPGMGFDIVPSDYLGKLLGEKVAAPKHLVLAVATKNTRPSHGTLKTILLEIGGSSIARRSSGIAPVDKNDAKHSITLKGRIMPAMRAPLADLFCANLSTGIKNIDTYLVLPRHMQLAMSVSGAVRMLGRLPLMRDVLSMAVSRLPNGPTVSQQQSGSGYIIGDVIGKDGSMVHGEIKTPEPYVYTADLLFRGASSWLKRGLAPGFHTPSQAFDVSILGPDVKIDFSEAPKK